MRLRLPRRTRVSRKKAAPVLPLPRLPRHHPPGRTSSKFYRGTEREIGARGRREGANARKRVRGVCGMTAVQGAEGAGPRSDRETSSRCGVRECDRDEPHYKRKAMYVFFFQINIYNIMSRFLPLALDLRPFKA